MGFGYQDWDSHDPAYLDEIDLEPIEDETEDEREERIQEALEYERDQQARFRAIAAVYERANRILTGDPVEVTLTKNRQAPSAWNDGRIITLNTAILRNYADPDLLSLHGVDYHEVAHILYTPRVGSEIWKWIIEKGYLHKVAFNILEDQRIETLLTARYPSTRHYLTASVLRYVMENGNPKDAYPLIHGRRYIDANVRKAAEAAYRAGRHARYADEIGSIIDEYRLLSFPKDTSKAKDLISKLSALYFALNHEGSPCEERNPAKNGRPEPASAQQADAKRAQTQEQQETDDREAADKAEHAPDDTHADVVKGLEEEDAKGDEKSGESWNDKVADEMNKALEELESKSEVKREMREFRRAVRNNERLHNGLKQSAYDTRPVAPENINAAREFGEVLRMIEEEATPAWEVKTPNGRLNINRAMHADINDIDKLFDRWYEGSDAVEIEAAVLLDRSGSMAYRMREACEALWVIRRGLNRVGARVSAYAFNHKSTLLYSADEPTDPRSMRVINSSGDTNPLRALEDTEFIMEASTRATKMVFIVTDGVWGQSKHSNQCIRRMQDMGVFVSVIYIGDLKAIQYLASQGNEYYQRSLIELRHGADIMRAVSSARDLVSVARSITTEYLKGKTGR